MPRQVDEQLQREIEHLIREEPDQSERTRLIIMLQLVRNLTDNIGITAKLVSEFAEHRKEFERHVTEEIRLINQARGVHRALTVVFPAIFVVINALAGYYIREMHNDWERIKAHVESNSMEIIRLKQGATNANP